MDCHSAASSSSRFGDLGDSMHDSCPLTILLGGSLIPIFYIRKAPGLVGMFLEGSFSAIRPPTSTCCGEFKGQCSRQSILYTSACCTAQLAIASRPITFGRRSMALKTVFKVQNLLIGLAIMASVTTGLIKFFTTSV